MKEKEEMRFYPPPTPLNATKTELIYFRNKRTPKPITKIKLNGITLEETTHAKYVGLVLDEYLDFKRHITLLNAKLKRANNLIAISRHYVPKDLLMQMGESGKSCTMSLPQRSNFKLHKSM